MSQQLSDGLPWNCIRTFMVPRWRVLVTLTATWLFIQLQIDWWWWIRMTFDSSVSTGIWWIFIKLNFTIKACFQVLGTTTTNAKREIIIIREIKSFVVPEEAACNLMDFLQVCYLIALRVMCSYNIVVNSLKTPFLFQLSSSFSKPGTYITHNAT